MTSITHWTSLGDERREDAIKMVLEKGETPEALQAVATKYGVHVKTMKRYMKAYHQNGRTRRLPMGGSKKIYD